MNSIEISLLIKAIRKRSRHILFLGLGKGRRNGKDFGLRGKREQVFEK